MDVLFDIDGTLVESYPMEDVLYDRALSEVGLSLPTTDYHALGASTDVSILRVLARQAWDRAPTDDEVETVRRAHTDGWREHLSTNPIDPIQDAGSVVGELRARGLRIAAATGGFRVTASLKLAAVGIDLEIAAAAEDGDDRTALLRRAAGRSRPLYVGDGLWDAEAARAAGLAFVAIARDAERAESFRARGSRVIGALTSLLELV